MNLCYEQHDKDYIRVDLMPQRDNTVRVDVYTRNLQRGNIEVQAVCNVELTHGHGNESWTKFLLFSGAPTATLTYAVQSCSICYGEDKKVYLSGDLPVAPYWNGSLTATEKDFGEYVIVE